MSNRFAGRTALVTGAARGIGHAIAQRLVREGARVLLTDVEAGVAETAAGLGQPSLVADITSQSAVEELFAVADRELGSLDVLINNAGIIGSPASLLDLQESAFDRVLDINLKAVLRTTQHGARRMIAQRRGAIVNLASMAAVMASGDQIPYAVSKAAVKQLTATSALSLAPYGIRVNAVGPGAVETPMLASLSVARDDSKARALSRIPLGRFAQPGEIAAIAAFLASDDASYLTGQTIFADGGRMALAYFTEPPAAA